MASLSLRPLWSSVRARSNRRTKSPLVTTGVAGPIFQPCPLQLLSRNISDASLAADSRCRCPCLAAGCGLLKTIVLILRAKQPRHGIAWHGWANEVEDSLSADAEASMTWAPALSEARCGRSYSSISRAAVDESAQWRHIVFSALAPSPQPRRSRSVLRIRCALCVVRATRGGDPLPFPLDRVAGTHNMSQAMMPQTQFISHRVKTSRSAAGKCGGAFKRWSITAAWRTPQPSITLPPHAGKGPPGWVAGGS